jgi:dienelactone hydrolase
MRGCVLAVVVAALLAPAAVAKPTTITGELPRRAATPLEDTPSLETQYGAVRVADGVRLRTFLTRPEGARTSLPAIFFVQWVSCGSLEFRPDRPNLLRDLAQRSGMVLIRVDRAGTGDSEGLRCERLDHDTEIAHYRAAFEHLSRHPWVDPDRIVIYGSSLGASNAPLVADSHKVAGILVQGGGALSYLERMVNFDSLQLERSGTFAPERYNVEMARRIAFEQAYLLGRQTPAQVVAAHPELAGVWESLPGTEPSGQYGRPFAWHWQLAGKNLLAAWTRVMAPVLVVYGEYDQYETQRGHRLIVDTLNALRPDSATWLEIPQADHDLDLYPDARAAYRREGGRRAPERFLDPVIAWLGKVTGR